MGLDVSAYARCTLASDQRIDDGEPCAEDGVIVYHNDDFPGRCDEFPDRSVIEYGQHLDGPSHSYGGYNEWRDDLSKLAGYKSAKQVFDEVSEGPFYELIDFGDNEGAIGTAVSAKLAKDFAAFQEKADTYSDEYFRTRYAQWRAAFEFASDGGFVDFH